MKRKYSHPIYQTLSQPTLLLLHNEKTTKERNWVAVEPFDTARSRIVWKQKSGRSLSAYFSTDLDVLGLIRQEIPCSFQRCIELHDWINLKQSETGRGRILKKQNCKGSQILSNSTDFDVLGLIRQEISCSLQRCIELHDSMSLRQARSPRENLDFFDGP